MDYRKFQALPTSVHFGDAQIHLYCFSPAEDAPSLTPGTHCHCHFYHECHLLTDGSFTFFVDGKQVPVSRSQLLIIPPFAEHHPFDGNFAHDLVFSVTLEQGKGEDGYYRYFSQVLASLAMKPLSVSDAVISQIRAFADLRNEKDIGSLCRRKAAAYAIIGGLISGLEDGFQQQGTDAGCNDPLFLLEHLVIDTALSLSEISRIIGYSTRHTSRMIRGLYGKNFRDIRRKEQGEPL